VVAQRLRLFINGRFPKRSILFTWLLSYLVVLLLPVGVGMITYFRINQTMIGEINRSNRLVLSKMKADLDGRLADMQRLSIEIALNPYVQELLNIKGALQPEQQFEVYKALGSLKVYASSNRANQYFVYFKNIDMIITAETANTSEALFKQLTNDSAVNYTEWLNLFTPIYHGEFVRVSGDKESAPSLDEMVYIRSLPLGKQGPSEASIVIPLNQSWLWMTEGEETGYNENVIILGGEQELLSSSLKMKGSLALQEQKFDGPSGVIRSVIDGEPVVISYIRSGVTDWTYMIVMPERVFWDRSDYIIKSAFAALAVCLLGGGGLTIAFARRNYSPVRRLLQLLQNQPYPAGRKQQALNEYDVMQEAIHFTLMENHDMSSRLWRQKNLLRSQCIEKLLKGRAGAIPLELSLEANGLLFDSDAFAVLIIHVEDYNEISFPLIRFAIMNVAEEWAAKRHQGFMAEADDLLVGLINFSSKVEEASWQEDLAVIAREVKAFMETYYHISISVSISAVHHSTIGISEAYKEVLEVLEYQEIYGMTSIVSYGSIQSPCGQSEYYYPLEKERALMNCMKTGDLTSAEAMIDEIFHDNLEAAKPSMKMVKYLFVDIASTMIKTVQELGGSSRYSPVEEWNVGEQLLRLRTFTDMKQELKQMLGEICRHIHEEQNNRRSMVLFKRIMDKVQADYSNVNLNIAAIAEEIGLHPVYVSKMFKEGAGLPLLDYIAQCRVEQAKRQMAEQPELTIEEIAHQVGYSSVRTFRRAFSKFEGIPPRKYSDMI
jgi:AraC-like DNA-binding protein